MRMDNSVAYSIFTFLAAPLIGVVGYTVKRNVDIDKAQAAHEAADAVHFATIKEKLDGLKEGQDRLLDKLL